MKQLPLRSRQKSISEWVSAIGTLLVLVGVYTSMDNFASFATDIPKVPQMGPPVSVSSPYWSERHGYGFRSVAGDSYSSTGNASRDIVSIEKEIKDDTTGSVTVSYYKDTPIDIIDKSLRADTPRAYARLAGGIAVIEGDLDSPRAKTIFSTLHSD